MDNLASDLRQSSNWASYLKSIGWHVENINSNFIYLKKIPLLGWFAKIQRPESLKQETINFIETKYKPFSFSIEPSTNNNLKLLTNLNFKISPSPSLPSKTLILDLYKSETELLKSFSQKTRYNIKLSQNKNIKIIESKNILEFTRFWRKNFEKNRFLFLSQQKNIIALYKAFGGNSKILLAKKDNKIIAVLFLLIFKKSTYYMYAASNKTGRTNFAPTLLVWEAILLSKKLGNNKFDFDGIYDERFPIKSWLGFTKFKYGFSKKEIIYPGIFIKRKFLF